MRSFPWFLLLTFSARVFCALVNITIDDIDPRIQYSPAGAWNARNSSQNCSTCPSQVEPNPSEMFSHTWHEGLFSPIPGVTNFTNMPLFLNMTFNGTAVYVFGALAQSTAAVPVAYDMGFYIDNRLRYTFSQSGENLNSSYEYNICLFAISDLALGDHTLVLQNGQPNATESLVLLDYIVYTGEDESIPKSPSSNPETGASLRDTPRVVATAVTVPVVSLLLILASVYVYRRWRQSQKTELDIQLHCFRRWRRCPVVPVPPPVMDSWLIEPVALPPSHPASGYVNGSGKPVTTSVPSAPTSSGAQQDTSAIPRHSRPTSRPTVPTNPLLPGPTEVSGDGRRSHRPVSSSASTSSYGRVIYIHNLSD